MDELVKLLVQRAGVTEEQAVKSIETIKEYIQSQLPPMMQGMIDNFISSSQTTEKDPLD